MARGKIIILGILAGFLLFPSLSYSQLSVDFNVPALPNSAEISSEDFQLGDKHIYSTVYSTNDSIANISGYYKNFFTQNSFNKLLDEAFLVESSWKLRFKKEDLVVDVIILTKSDNSREATVAKYLQPPGSPSLEETKPSVKDPLFALPKEDVPGKDIPGIPRPPQGVRIVNIDNTNLTYAIYTTPLSVDEAVGFYNSSLVNAGWKMLNEVSAGQAADSYERVSGKDDFSRIQSPFSEGENLSDVVKQSYVLFFRDSAGSQARITVMPNFTDKKSGSMVQISYTEAK